MWALEYGMTMRRREFIAGPGVAPACPMADIAQRAAMAVVGYLSSRTPALEAPAVPGNGLALLTDSDNSRT